MAFVINLINNIFSIVTFLAVLSYCNDNLNVAFEWKQIEFDYMNSTLRQKAIDSKQFIPSNVIPVGLEVYQSRLFLTLPRLKEGIPASLVYLDFNDTTTKSPSLKPYPSWQAHMEYNEEPPEIVSPIKMQADRCGRLWLLDTGVINVLGERKTLKPAQLLVYDLHNDNLLRRYQFPENQLKKDSFIANIAVEDADCENTYAYCADINAPGLIVYSWKSKESWRVQHNFFHPDPLAGNFTIGDINFQSDDGLFGLAVSKSGPDGYSDLYFHPFSSTREFFVSTSVLRNKMYATSSDIYYDFKILGSRGPNAQAGASYLDQSTGVLFYAVPNLNAVACWKTSNKVYSIKSQGRVFMNPTVMNFPSDVKVDDQNRLWVLSNRLHMFMYKKLNENDINFRILTATVNDAIKNTTCETNTKPLPDIISQLGSILQPSSTPKNSASKLIFIWNQLSIYALLTLFAYFFN